jgi:hypothetical protein
MVGSNEAASSKQAARIYIDNQTMQQLRRLLSEQDPALLATLDSDTAVARYAIKLGVVVLQGRRVKPPA